MSSNVLSDRDANAQVVRSSPEKKEEEEKPKTLDYHRQMLNKRLNGDKTQQYASPTDEIMSPATQKLSTFRHKQLLKKAKPQTLFKTSSSKNYESAKGASLFADMPTDSVKNDTEEQA